MAKADKIIQRMKNNPRDWRIEEIRHVALRHGFDIRQPRGSHITLSHPSLEMILTIPAHRPVKPIYIRKLLDMINTLRQDDSNE
ncbi:type II toxin-antitoxin system HicA family toxin [Magnetococcales bacterium HHB-1]